MNAVLTPTTDHTFHWDVPDGWQQGRGAFGGLVLSTMVRALEAEHFGGEQSLRSLTAVMCAPVLAERADIAVTRVRAGSGTTVLRATLTQGDEVRSEATGIFGKRRAEDADWNEYEPPRVPSWRELQKAPVGAPMAPTFSANFDFFPVAGFPFSGAEKREVLGWVRSGERGERHDAASLTMLMDVWWPGCLPTFTAPRPIGTMAFSMQFTGDTEGLDPDVPLLFRGSSPVSRGGYSLDLRELWSEDGRLLALNQQTIAIIK